jgi:LysR family transcriptional regulator, hypochlorite-specific transcription factor HypT
MKLEWIKDLQALFETGSFSRAADRRHVTQPAFSRRIQALETWVGTPLVDRESSPPTLTSTGKLFLSRSADLIRQAELLRQDFLVAQPHASRVIHVTTADTLCHHWLPYLHMHTSREISDVTFAVANNSRQDSIQMLSDGSAEFMLCYSHKDAPVLLPSKRFPRFRLGSETLVPVSAANTDGEPLFRLPGLEHQPLLFAFFGEEMFLGHMVQRAIAAQPVKTHLTVCYVNARSEALKSMILRGIGMGWIPQTLACDDLKSGRLVLAGGSKWFTTVDIMIYRDAHKSTPITDLIWRTITGKALRQLKTAAGLRNSLLARSPAPSQVD